MTKSKLKKSYCIMSFVFAVAVLIIALTLSMGQTRVYAADTSSDMITGLSNTDSSDGLTDATSDINNGLSITYNNDTGAVSTPIKALLVLTIISLAPSILIMMTSYTRTSSCCISCAPRSVHRQHRRIRFSSVLPCF